MITQLLRARTVQEIRNTEIGKCDLTHRMREDPRYPDAIGSGSGGDVFRRKLQEYDSTSGQYFYSKVVVKVLRGTTDEKPKIEERISRELVTWGKLKHPNISDFLGIAYIRQGQPPGLVSRYAQRHNVLLYLDRHPEQKLKKAKEIVGGLRYLHYHNVVHGDVKLDNVIISDDHLQAQLTDFGVSQILGVSGFTTVFKERNCRYSAPELMPIHDPASGEEPLPDFATDIFSLGILLLQLFHGYDPIWQRCMPYNHIRCRSGYDLSLIRKIHSGDRPIRERYNYIKDIHWSAIQWCWSKNPAQRPTATDVMRML